MIEVAQGAMRADKSSTESDLHGKGRVPETFWKEKFLIGLDQKILLEGFAKLRGLCEKEHAICHSTICCKGSESVSQRPGRGHQFIKAFVHHDIMVNSFPHFQLAVGNYVSVLSPCRLFSDFHFGPFEVKVVHIFIKMWQLKHLCQSCLRWLFKMKIIGPTSHLLHQTLCGVVPI